MKKFASIRRMSMKILETGQSKIWFNPNEREKIMAADTLQRIRELVDEGVIVKKLDKVNSRANARKREIAKNKGRHMGKGSKKGTKNARLPKKTVWMKTLRSKRSTLKEMKNAGELNSEEYHSYRQMAKGNQFRLNKKVMLTYIEKKKDEQKRLDELRAKAEAMQVRNV